MTSTKGRKMLYRISEILLLLLKTNLYRLHVLMLDTGSHVHKIMLMSVKSGYGVAYSVLLW